ncbi:hypothetical protein GQ53DRAFT_719364 [Thozetella sp. PMI_491]|nr:hypothetical protein GQ53DRAFT_719364 [Thozetella sp. PMI_491]
MLGTGQDGRTTLSSESPTGRVSEACARCRRQKLKCDKTRPCIMCVRSGMECQPRLVAASKPRKRRANNARSSDALDPPRTSKQRQTTSTAARSGPAISSTEAQQFGANRSAISLATNVYENLGTHAPTETSAIPGDASPTSASSSTWTLQSMEMPPQRVMDALIEVYFDKMHWFIWIFHKPSFLDQALQILSVSSWQRRDMGKVLVTLTVAAIGLKCAIQNTSSDSQQFLASVSSNPRKLIDQIIAEVRTHLVDLLDDNCIETVQVSLLLGALYIFHGSPSLAWATIGLAVRASYALALHCASESDSPIATQIRRRCWNHLTVADTFASQIYGRPAALDPAFSDLLPLAEMDDTIIDISDGSQIQDDPRDSVNALTFHCLKYRLYAIIRKTLSTFRLLRLHNPMTVEELESLIGAVQTIDAQLMEWKATLPRLLSGVHISGHDASGGWSEELLDNYDGQDGDFHRLRLQAHLLRITYDAAIILAHRPLLEHKLSSEYSQGLSKSTTESVSKSFDLCVKAALRISRTPVMQFKHEFCMAFIFVHLFTAGVILCIPPTSHPFSSTAQDAKTGAFRIIQAAKALSPHSHIARHTERLLSDLLKLSLHREVDLAFKEKRRIDRGENPRRSPVEVAPINDSQAPRIVTTEQHRNLPVLGPNGSYYVDNASHILLESSSEATLSPHQRDSVAANLHDRLVEPYLMFNNLANADGFGTRPLDLQLDETFGAFGQVMFNLMPDDPLNTWGWGKGLP